MNELTIKELYNLDYTEAKPLLEQKTYPWEVLPEIANFITFLGSTLSSDQYEKRGENIWIAKTAKIAPQRADTIKRKGVVCARAAFTARQSNTLSKRKFSIKAYST